MIFLDFCLDYVSHGWGVPHYSYKLQISPFFVRGKTWKIGSVSNTYLPHCSSNTQYLHKTPTVFVPHMGQNKTTGSIHRCRHYSSLELLISKGHFCVQSHLYICHDDRILQAWGDKYWVCKWEMDHLLFLQQSDFQFIPSMKTLENMVDSANQLIFSHKNDLLDVLQETAEKLRVLQSVKSRKETGSEQSSNGRRRSAGLHTRLSRSSGHFVSFTPRVCVEKGSLRYSKHTHRQ